ncbi:MAG TPA: biopolymer transporter ExbD [Verrucomicrobiae bacterium]|nr:biopolymer transporter ExbD [Verrucomicrobiae bacterium]
MKVKRRNIRRARIEIIPMIDTIVILLIFYMSFSRFAEAERAAGIKLPIALEGDSLEKRPNQIIVNMIASGNVTIDGRAYSISDLPELLRRLKANRPNFNSVILRGSRTMTYQDLSAFMVACSKAGIADITFATVDK